jgi:hypothetical protein
MSSDNPALDAPAPKHSRRVALAAGGIAAAGAAAAVVAAKPQSAEAANGSALIIGSVNSASAGTTLNVTGSRPGLTVNAATGAAASFASTGSNGFAGGTHSNNAYGLSAANFATTQGGGAGIAANGEQNTGATVATSGNNRYGLVASHRGSTVTTGTTGAGFFDGGAADGIVGQTEGNPDNFAGVTGYGSPDGGPGVVGGGFPGVLGLTGTGGAGIYGFTEATADATTTAVYADANGSAALALQTNGDALITGNLTVTGTIFCPNTTIQTPPAVVAQTAGARALNRRANAVAARVRARS